MAANIVSEWLSLSGAVHPTRENRELHSRIPTRIEAVQDRDSWRMIKLRRQVRYVLDKIRTGSSMGYNYVHLWQIAYRVLLSMRPERLLRRHYQEQWERLSIGRYALMLRDRPVPVEPPYALNYEP